MDVFSYLSKAYETMKLIKKTIDDVKDAPDSLRLLRLRASSIERLLNKLHQLPPYSLSGAEGDDLQCLEAIAVKSLDEVGGFVAKMLRIGKNGDAKVNIVRFLQSKAFGKTIEGLSAKLDDLEKALSSICDIVALSLAPSQCQVLEEVVAALHRLDMAVSALSVRTSTATHRPLNAPFRNRLRCLEGCACRCHSPGTSQVIAGYLAPYIGQVHVPKRRPCNVQTCRQDQSIPGQAVWFLPSWMFKVEAQISSPFYLSIRTPRFVRNDAPIWELIMGADVDGVRGLLLSGEASVHDVDEDGDTVLYYAHDAWVKGRQFATSGQVMASHDIIKLLVEAGADPEFSIGQNRSMKELLAISSLETLIEHPDGVFAHQVKTSTLVIDICHPIFHIDAIDLVEDLLECQGIQSDSDPVAAALLGYSGSAAITHADIFQHLFGWTTLEYAALYHPDHIESLLQRGEDATMGALLVMVADSGNTSIIKPLIAAGARVNAYQHTGMTALHIACYHLNIDTLETLIKSAEEDEIDWEVRTRDGRNLNALQVAQASPYHAWRPTSDVQEIFDILRAHISGPYEELHDVEEPFRMPGGLA